MTVASFPQRLFMLVVLVAGNLTSRRNLTNSNHFGWEERNLNNIEFYDVERQAYTVSQIGFLRQCPRRLTSGKLFIGQHSPLKERHSSDAPECQKSSTLIFQQGNGQRTRFMMKMSENQVNV